MLHPVSLWDVVNVLIDSLGGLSVDEALDAATRHLPENVPRQNVTLRAY